MFTTFGDDRGGKNKCLFIWQTFGICAFYCVRIEKTSNFFRIKERDQFVLEMVFKLPSIEDIAQVVSSHYGLSATLKNANIVSDNMCSLNNESN